MYKKMMKNTLKNKLKIALLGGALIGSGGCAAAGISGNDNPFTMGMKAVRYMNGGNMGNNNNNANLTTQNGKYLPAPGYEWINPKNNSDLRVRRKTTTTTSIKKVPTIRCVGDIDNDGIVDWEYQATDGKNYRAKMDYTNKYEQHLNTRNFRWKKGGDFTVMSFQYYDYEKNKKYRVPDNFSIIGCR
jgi:hypothetical protein